MKIFCRNKAIADYLASNGYVKSLAEFQKEAEMVCIILYLDSKFHTFWGSMRSHIFNNSYLHGPL